MSLATQAPGVETNYSGSRSSRQQSSSDEVGTQINLGETERWLSLVGGVSLVFLGLTNRTNRGLFTALLGGGLLYRGWTGHSPIYAALSTTADRDGENAPSILAGNGVRIRVTFTVQRPARDLYAFWRNFSNLPIFMRHLDAVTVTDERRSHWTAVGPLSTRWEWDAEIVEDHPKALISWQSTQSGDIDCAGAVRFKQTSRGTEVQVNMRYDLLGAQAGTSIVQLFGQSPEQLLREDLRRFKQLMETGEIPTIENQPHGTCGY